MKLPLPSGDRAHWKTLTAGIGLLLVGALTVINSVELSRLSAQNRSDTQDARIQVLATRLADIAGQIERPRELPESPESPESPKSVSLAHYDADRQTLEQRLTNIEQALNERLLTKDWLPLQERLDQLEQRLMQYPARTPTTTHPNPARAKAIEPSFRVVSTELRAHERFLTILPAGANSLSQARLLRVGDKEEGWRLDAIEDEAAIFSQSGKTQRVSFGGKRP
ncbi:hypothetical protein FACS1894158_06090 [Betaproteobacteria bacterium]|nr:hypothetical protein FACS1894158_06090 [Betaproteobacteria bacterium]